MSVLFNIADKITFGTEPPDYYTFKKRVLDDGGVVLDDAQLRADMLWVWQNKPSWFASPAVSKVGVLYGAPDLDGTITRATVKTGIDADGVLGERVADERPWSYVDGRIADLIEPSATNQLTQSNEFRSLGATVTVNKNLESPFGTANEGWTVARSGGLTFATSGITSNLNFNPTSSIGVILNYYLKYTGDNTTVRFESNSSTRWGGFWSVDFLITDVGVTIDSQVRAVGKILETTSNGWTRVEIYIDTITGDNNTDFVLIRPEDNKSFGVASVDWIKDATLSTSHIPTSGTAQTRNADVLTVTGASGVIGQTEGGLAVGFRTSNANTNRTIATMWENQGDFGALSQTTRAWLGMTSANGDVYASVFNGDIYKQTGGTGDFFSLGQTSRNWYGMTTLGSDVYCCVNGGDIYKQTGGTGDFIALGQTSRSWVGMTTLGSDVYACVAGGDIYKQTGGTGDFIALGQTSRAWIGMTVLGSDVYASVVNGDIYKQTGGTGDFIALGQTTRVWVGMTTLGSDVYCCVIDGDIYKQVGGTGDFISLGQTSRQWRFMTTLGNDVYASVAGGDIYKQVGGDFIKLRLTGENRLVAHVRTAGLDQALIQSSALTTNTRYGAVLNYANNSVFLSLDGAQVGSTDTSATIPTCSKFNIGQDELATTQFNGNIMTVANRKTALSLADANALSLQLKNL